MKKNKAQSIVGILLIFGQSFIICYLFFRLNNLFFINQVIDLISIIAPLFCAYLIAITKNFLSKANPKKQPIVSFNYVFVSVFYPLFFILSLFMAIKCYEYQTIESFVGLKKIIGAIETTFGIYLGIIIDKVFANPSE